MTMYVIGLLLLRFLQAEPDSIPSHAGVASTQPRPFFPSPTTMQTQIIIHQILQLSRNWDKMGLPNFGEVY